MELESSSRFLSLQPCSIFIPGGILVRTQVGLDSQAGPAPLPSGAMVQIKKTQHEVPSCVTGSQCLGADLTWMAWELVGAGWGALEG